MNYFYYLQKNYCFIIFNEELLEKDNSFKKKEIKKLLMYLLLRLWRGLQLTMLPEPRFHADLNLLERRSLETRDRPARTEEEMKLMM